MVGSSILNLLQKNKYKKIITVSKKKINFLDQKKTFSFLKKTKPDAVIIAAAKVGGIRANNNYRGDFIYENLQIQNNLIHGSYLAGIKKLIFLGSSCIYPKKCKQPIKESYLLTDSLEYTNEPYAIAKIAGLKMIENYNLQYKTNYLCLMPCNLYGPNDNYDLNNSHFIPAIIKKIHLSIKKNQKEIILWGDGSPKREVMFVDDLSRACIHFLNIKTNENYINIGSGEEYSIKQYAKKISNILGYKGKFIFDLSQPNGTPRKLLNSSIANSYNWRPNISFEEGIKLTYEDFKRS